MKTQYFGSDVWAQADMFGIFVVDKPHYSVIEWGNYVVTTFGNYRTGGTLVIQYRFNDVYTTTVYKMTGPLYDDIEFVTYNAGSKEG